MTLTQRIKALPEGGHFTIEEDPGHVIYKPQYGRIVRRKRAQGGWVVLKLAKDQPRPRRNELAEHLVNL